MLRVIPETLYHFILQMQSTKPCKSLGAGPWRGGNFRQREIVMGGGLLLWHAGSFGVYLARKITGSTSGPAVDAANHMQRFYPRNCSLKASVKES